MKGITILVALLCPFALGAQGTPADTALQRQVKVWLDTLARDKTAPAYSKRARAKIDTLLRAHLKPVVPTPPPQPLPQPDSGVVVVTDTSSTVELPRDSVRTAYPTITRSYAIGASLQTALDTAKAGDEIKLVAGQTYTENVTWTRCLSGVVTITGPSGPAEGVRITPALAAFHQYPKLVSATTSPVVLARSGGCKLRVSRIEVTAIPPSSTVNYNYGLVRVGDGETVLEQQPSEIVLDRVYLHGSAATFTQNGLIANGRAVALVDSWVDQIRWKGVESHCVIAWAGAGPIALSNNHFDCASIDVLIGGAARTIAGVAPSDITVRGNHFTKDSTFAAGYVAKNLFELKDARRVLLENNVIENAWYEAQSAMAINLQSLTDEKNASVQTSDVTVRWNRIRNAGQCAVLSARGYNGVASPMARVVMEQNLCTDIGIDSISRAILLTGNLQGVTLRHNTLVRRSTPRKGSVTYVEHQSGPQATNVDISDNIIGPGLDYPCVFGEGLSGSAALANYAPMWRFAGNGCFDSHPGASAFPADNTFAASLVDVGFNADWSLAAGSPFRGKASDGRDPGVDVAELTRRTAGVVSPVAAARRSRRR